jgi:uncharacterized protein YktB (UPF0637 family)
MARKKASPETDEPPKDGTAATTSPSEGNGEKKLPAFKVGPIATDKNGAVVATVWENEIQAGDGRSFKVHNVTVEARYFDPDAVNADGSKGQWKTAKSFRGSQLYVVIYCLQRVSDFILGSRDPENNVPF